MLLSGLHRSTAVTQQSAHTPHLPCSRSSSRLIHLGHSCLSSCMEACVCSRLLQNVKHTSSAQCRSQRQWFTLLPWVSFVSESVPPCLIMNFVIDGGYLIHGASRRPRDREHGDSFNYRCFSPQPLHLVDHADRLTIPVASRSNPTGKTFDSLLQS